MADERRLAARVARLERERDRLAHQRDVLRWRLERDRARLAHQRDVARWQLARLEQRRAVRMLGAVRAAMRSPLRLLALPLTLLRVLASRQRLPARPEAPDEPAPPPEPPPRRQPAPEPKAASPKPAKAPRYQAPELVEAPLPDGPVVRPGLRVATILDEFSRLGWGYEADLHELTPADWRETLERVRPHLLLVESAWRGLDDAWRWQLSEAAGPSDTVREVVAWCRDHGVPTVFWNKEDPPNYAKFVRTAALFDHVLTVDVGSLPAYRRDLGHDRLGVLPFAAQPRIHHPIHLQDAGRDHQVAFAGTYIAHNHPHRKVQVAQVLDAARAHDLHIFSRRDAGKNYAFPPPFDEHVVGTLTYPQTLTAYKRYKVFCNVNSVVKSPTMCARRIFELLACGAGVLSGASPAIRALLGPELVAEAHDPDEAAERLASLLGDDERRERLAVAGLRRVLAEHTYAQRFERILEVAGLADLPEARPVAVDDTVAAIVPSDEPGVEQVLEDLAAQRRVPDEVLCVGARAPESVAERARALGLAGVRSVAAEHWLPAGVAESSASLLWPVAADAAYGPSFLADQLAARQYTTAAAIGKRTHWRVTGAGDDGLEVVDPGLDHRFVSALARGSVLIERARCPQAALDAPDEEALLDRLLAAGGQALSTHRFELARCVAGRPDAGQRARIEVPDAAPAERPELLAVTGADVAPAPEGVAAGLPAPDRRR